MVQSQIADHQAAARSFLDAGVRASRIGDRPTHAVALWGVAGELAGAGASEVAAAVLGWVRAVLGDYRGNTFNGHLAGDLDALTSRLTDRQYAALTERGAAMDAEEILRIADEAVDRVFPVPTQGD
jgi:hypothetical protein